MISEEQIQAIKQQLIQQIEATFPEDKKFSAIEQIKEMSPDQLIEFLKQNNLIQTTAGSEIEPSTQKEAQTKTPTTPAKPQTQKCVFCSIVDGQIPSYKIDENKAAIAILEINPISKGHSLIIPKEHIPTNDQLPQQAFSLAKKISKKLKSKMKPKPKQVEIGFSNVFGHEVINIFPVYDDENFGSPRYQEEKPILEKLQKKLEKKSKKPAKQKTKTQKDIKKKKPKSKETKIKDLLPKRIP